MTSVLINSRWWLTPRFNDFPAGSVKWADSLLLALEHYKPKNFTFKGLQWCRPQWFSPHWWIWQPAWYLKEENIHQNRHQKYKENGGRLNSCRETYLQKTPWHNWHGPEEASGTEVAAVAQWWGQQCLLGPSVSAVVVEWLHAEAMLLVAPSRWGPW